MEDMLRRAMAAAETDPMLTRTFDQVLSRYQQHPGVIRRRREAVESRRLVHERTNRACYWSARKRLPSRVGHYTRSLDELVDAGCSWDLAHELMRFPILRLLAQSTDELERIPIHELLQYSIDRRMDEHQARAAIFFAVDRFDAEHGHHQQQMGGRKLRADWLETQRRIFAELEERNFDPPSPAKPRPPRPQPPQREARQSSLLHADSGGGVADESKADPAIHSSTAKGALLAMASDARGDSADEAAAAAPSSPIDVPVGGTHSPPTTPPDAMTSSSPSAPSTVPIESPDQAEDGANNGGGTAPLSGDRSDQCTLSQMPVESAGSSTELLELLGQGTYGAVWRGRHGGETVAIKVLSLIKETVEMIQREVDVMKACECEHIVAYRDAFQRQVDGRLALLVVMELADHGSTLDAMRRRDAPLPEAAIGWVCSGVLKGLHYMHTVAHAIHRDVKAANVLLLSGGRVKLADLGVAAQLQRTMSKRGTMIGTPHWMAPEAFAPESGDAQYDARVDIWSLGITAIELAEMQPPHAENKFIFQVMMRIASGPPPLLSAETEATAAFRSFVGSALVQEASARPGAAFLLSDPFISTSRADGLLSVLAELARTAEHARIEDAPATVRLDQADESGDTLMLSASDADSRVACRVNFSMAGSGTLQL